MIDPSTETRDIWTFEVGRGLLSRLSSDRTEERSQVWTPDSQHLIFNSGASGAFDLFRLPASGVGAREPVLVDGRSKDPMAVSADGQLLVYRVTGETNTNDIWVLPLTGDAKPFPFLSTRFDENYARLSSSGRWIAYTSGGCGEARGHGDRVGYGETPVSRAGPATAGPAVCRHGRWPAVSRHHRLFSTGIAHHRGRQLAGAAIEAVDHGPVVH